VPAFGLLTPMMVPAKRREVTKTTHVSTLPACMVTGSSAGIADRVAVPAMAPLMG
jgi:hypothetical protein